MPKVAMLFVTTTGIPIGDALVEIRLTRTDFEDKTSGVIMTRLEEFRTHLDGSLLVELVATGALYHVTAYDTVQDIAIHYDFYVPASDDPNIVYDLKDIYVPPDTYMSSMPFDETAMLAIINERKLAQAAAAAAKDSELSARVDAEYAAAAIVTVQETVADVDSKAAQVSTQHGEVNQWRNEVAADKAAVHADVVTVTQYENLTLQHMQAAQSAEAGADSAASRSMASASEANTSSTSAAGAALRAQQDAQAALAAKQSVDGQWADFDARYFGAFNAAPSVNAHGAAPVNGSLYWNSTVKSMFVWDNGAWRENPAAYPYTAAPNSANAFVKTQANGYLNSALLDPTLPLLTQNSIGVGVDFANRFAINYLHGGQVQALYKIASLPATSSGTYATIRVEAMLGGWGGNTVVRVSLQIGNRNGIAVDWSSSRGITQEARFVAFEEANGELSVYLFFATGSFTQATYQIMSHGAFTYPKAAGPVSSVSGILVWDSNAPPGTATYRPPCMQGIDNTNGVSFDTVLQVRTPDGAYGNSELYGGRQANTVPANAEVETMRMGISGNSNVNFPGFIRWTASAGNNNAYKEGYQMYLRFWDQSSNAATPVLLKVDGYGGVNVPGLATYGTANTEPQGVRKMEVFNCFAAYTVSGNYGNPAGAALQVATHSVTGSSIRTGGTVNTSGNDYAEYFYKAEHCPDVISGQIIGINDKNELSNLWADTVMFGIKSTNPSFVGGDDWAAQAGPEPVPTAGAKPVEPVRVKDEFGYQKDVEDFNTYSDIVLIKAGDTDEEWAEKESQYANALSGWETKNAQDTVVQKAFDAKLEAIRQRVDRIAIAGRAPVNVLGANPGDYIVPVQNGKEIGAIAVAEADMTLKQYLRALGQVISIEADGRAYVMVKAV